MNIVYRLNVSDGGNRVGLIRFSTNSYIDFFLDTYKTADEMSDFILNMPYEGGTCEVQRRLFKQIIYKKLEKKLNLSNFKKSKLYTIKPNVLFWMQN